MRISVRGRLRDVRFIPEGTPQSARTGDERNDEELPWEHVRGHIMEIQNRTTVNNGNEICYEKTINVQLTLRERNVIARVLEYTMQWSELPLYEHEYQALASFVEQTSDLLEVKL